MSRKSADLILPYEEAKLIVRPMLFSSKIKYKNWKKTKEGQKYPVPAMPQVFYKDGNFDWADYLGDAFIDYDTLMKQRVEWKYEDARAYVRTLKFTNSDMWAIYIKNNPLPKDFPRMPAMYYTRRKQWIGWPDFLGTTDHRNYNVAIGQIGTEEPVAPIEFNENESHGLPFATFKQNIRKLMFESMAQYKNWHAVNKMGAKGYPIDPDYFYSTRKVWTSWPDVLGKYDPNDPTYSDKCEYREAKMFAQSLNYKSEAEWRQFWIKNADYRGDIPRYPDKHYKLAWEGWPRFLGSQLSYRLSEDLYTGAVLFVAKTTSRVGNMYEVGINRDGPNSLLNFIYLSKEDWKVVKCYKFVDEVVNSIHKNTETFVKHLVSTYTAGEHYNYEGVIISNIFGLLSDLDYYFEPLLIEQIKIKHFEHPTKTVQQEALEKEHKSDEFSNSIMGLL